MHARDDADVREANALLLVLNAVGIPVLVRTFGETHAPPSATLGVLGALFHASTKPSSHHSNATNDYDNAVRATATVSLHTLVTSQRAITYHAGPYELLLVLAGDAPLAGAGSTRVFRCLSAALALLLGNQRFEATDAARQRLSLARHAETLDRVVRSSQRDVRVLFGRPLRALCSDQRILKRFAPTKAQQCLWLRDRVVVAEYVARGCRLRLDAVESVVLALVSECVSARGLQSVQYVVRVGCGSMSGGAIARVAIGVSAIGEVSCVGVFSEAATDEELQADVRSPV